MSKKKTTSQAPTLGTASKDKYFPILVKLEPTNEVFTLKKVFYDMEISELKHYAEFGTGVPYHMQRLHYLDEGDLQDHTDVRSNDIVPSSTLHMNVWNMWRHLVEAVASNDIDQVFLQGVTQDTDYKTPNSEYMGKSAKSIWVADRAFTALYIAAHRGYLKMCEKLIDAGADVNGRTSLGSTPLHVAAAMGHGTVVDSLLEKGADIDAVDKFGASALAVANKFGHKGCERHLFLFRWQQRAKKMKPQLEHELFAHQYFDSALPVWLAGKQAQIYYTQILPPGEFAGSGFEAPKRRPRSGSAGSVSTRDGTPERYSQLQDSTIQVELGGETLDKTRRLHSSTRATSGKRLGGMPAIREESPTSRSGSQSRGSGSQMGSRRPMSHASSAHSRKVSTDRKAIDKQTYGFIKQKKESNSKAKSFEEWIRKKQEAEQHLIDKKKAEIKMKRIAEEDKKRQEEMQDKSYEQWLAEKEQATNPVTKPATKPVGRRQAGLTVAATSTSSHQRGSDRDAQADTGPLTTQKIIRNIMKRREEEQGQRQMDHISWEMNKEMNLLEQIRAGKTHLQRMSQKV